MENGVRLRGFVDRIDVAPTGEVRVVDYKTGKAPREFTESKALFQMKFYALVLLRTRGIVPAQLRLIYLASGSILTYAPITTSSSDSSEPSPPSGKRSSQQVRPETSDPSLANCATVRSQVTVPLVRAEHLRRIQVGRTC